MAAPETDPVTRLRAEIAALQQQLADRDEQLAAVTRERDGALMPHTPGEPSVQRDSQTRFCEPC